jgi:hypothetical protein
MGSARLPSTMKQYAANIIAENLYAQVDPDEGF